MKSLFFSIYSHLPSICLFTFSLFSFPTFFYDYYSCIMSTCWFEICTPGNYNQRPLNGADILPAASVINMQSYKLYNRRPTSSLKDPSIH